jgi:prefoldin alpha subunit
MEQELNQEMQEKLVLYQLLQRQLEELRQHTLLIERKGFEIESTAAALEDIKSVNENNEILIPLGSGFFAFGKITDKSSVLMDIGAGLMKKGKPGSGIIKEKELELEKANAALKNETEKITNKMSQIGMELEKLAKESQK